MEAKFVPPRKCPHCGSVKTKSVVSDDWQNVEVSPTKNSDFDCPKCGKGFCGICFVPDLQGNGRTWHCPHCKELLKIPDGIEYKPEDLN